MSKESFLSKFKDYGGVVFVIICGLVSAAISYGSSQAATSFTTSNHEGRLTTLEQHDRDYNTSISSIKTDLDNTKREVHDIWLDMGHKESNLNGK